MSIAINTSWPINHHLDQSTMHPPLAPRNNIEFSREMLFTVLEHLSTVIGAEFSGMPIRLVAHGGACMLLHPGLHEIANRKEMHHRSRNENPSRRMTTRDVDYIHRSFVTESVGRGIINAGERLQKCIKITARQFHLGTDWMNSDADVALPMSTDPTTGATFDPIYAESVKDNNIQLYTVFVSSNKLLTIVNVTPFWAVALKLVRYTKFDPGDICLLLLYGTVTRGVRWTAEALEGWIRTNCSAMNYHNWDSTRIMDMRQKIAHAIALISSIGNSIMSQPGDPFLLSGRRVSPGVDSGAVTAVAHSAGLHRTLSPASISKPVPAITGIPWAGPASDAIAAKKRTPSPPSSEVQAETHSSRLSLKEYDHATLDPRRPRVSTHVRHTDHQKESRRQKKRFREHQRVLQRRLKYMLRSDEPDDSDQSPASGDSTDTECDSDGEANRGQAPIIPMISDSVPPPLHNLNSWGLTPALPNSGWTQHLATQEPTAMSLTSMSGNPSPALPAPEPPTQWSQSSHSQIWPSTRPHKPPRRTLTSPLLERPRR